MKKISHILTLGAAIFGLGFAALPVQADDDIGENCVPVSIKMAVGPGACEVMDYEVGDVGFQKAFYPWTNIDGSLFNCELTDTMVIGDWVMPSSLSGLLLEGTLGEEEVTGTVACAGHQNTWKQPFLKMGLPFIRTQNVSVARIDVPKGKKKVVSVHVAFSGAGVLHVEDLAAYEVGASTSGTVVGLVIEKGDNIYVSNKADGHLQVQGHIFLPDDEEPGMLTGLICDKKLAKLVDWEDDEDDDDDEDD